MILKMIFLTVGNILTSLRFDTSVAVEASEDDSDSEAVVLGEIDDENNDNITPALLHLAFNKPRSDVFEIDRRANTLLQTTNRLKNNTDNLISLRFFDVESSNAINNECPWTPLPTCSKTAERKYRNIDGTCNNLKNTVFGKAGTPFQRILEADYDPNGE